MQAAISTSEKHSGPSISVGLLRNCQDEHQKEVQFDAAAVDNEYELSSRQKRRHSISAAASQNSVIWPSLSSSINEAEAANISKRINSPLVTSQPAGYRPQEAERQLWETDSPYTVERHGVIHSQVQSPPFTVPLPFPGFGDPTATNPPAYQTSAKRPANSAAKRYKVPRRNTISHVPPRVTDAPSTSQDQKPPPAPRPARLSTPDLEDIHGEMFCTCDSDEVGKATCL